MAQASWMWISKLWKMAFREITITSLKKYSKIVFSIFFLISLESTTVFDHYFINTQSISNLFTPKPGVWMTQTFSTAVLLFFRVTLSIKNVTFILIFWFPIVVIELYWRSKLRFFQGFNFISEEFFPVIPPGIPQNVRFHPEIYPRISTGFRSKNPLGNFSEISLFGNHSRASSKTCLQGFLHKLQQDFVQWLIENFIQGFKMSSENLPGCSTNSTFFQELLQGFFAKKCSRVCFRNRLRKDSKLHIEILSEINPGFRIFFSYPFRITSKVLLKVPAEAHSGLPLRI